MMVDLREHAIFVSSVMGLELACSGDPWGGRIPSKRYCHLDLKKKKKKKKKLLALA